MYTSALEMDISKIPIIDDTYIKKHKSEWADGEKIYYSFEDVDSFRAKNSECTNVDSKS